MTHEELATLLGLRVHDTLLDLVREGAIRRQRLGPTFVYCSSQRSVEKEQTLRRKEFLEKRQRNARGLTPPADKELLPCSNSSRIPRSDGRTSCSVVGARE
jgi:hypothetical protein